MKDNIKEQVKLMPNLPGCYQYFDDKGEVIYVGKAKNLSKRVRSYFVKHKNPSPKLEHLVPKIAKIECIVVDSEIEALILENELIKKYKPKYNVLLKDDKKFPYFVITKEEYPRIIIARKSNLNALKGRYYGPYTDSRAMHVTLDILEKIFPLKKCKTPKFNSRPCLYYDIGKCTAPCQRLISPEDYQNILKKCEMFLSGKRMELIKILKREMELASTKLEFERAMHIRNSIEDILKKIEKQKVVSENTKLSCDYIASASDGGSYTASILQIREGRLINKKDFSFTQLDESSKEDVLETVVREYYFALSADNIPQKIITEVKLEEADILSAWLETRANFKVSIAIPKKKNELEILAMAKKNAELYLEQIKLKELAQIQNDYNEVGSWIQDKLNLPTFPNVIECYDISHTQGTNTVASRVVFEDGQPKKSKYRKYKIKTLQRGEVDDFKSMKEVLTRRLKRIAQGQDKAPDLFIIDGGKGQLSSVMEIVEEFGLNLNVVSLAKREEEVFLPNQSEPVIFPRTSPALYLFQRIRDEAHRFAITFHKSLRAKELKK